MTRLLLLLATACSSAAQPPPVIASHAAPGACDDMPLVTLADLARGLHVHERVAFDTVPVADQVQTLIGCGPDNKCCNHVSGGYVAELKDHVELELKAPFRCTGNECEWHCEPFGNHPTQTVRFVGVLDDIPQQKFGSFTVEKFCAR